MASNAHITFHHPARMQVGVVPSVSEHGRHYISFEDLGAGVSIYGTLSELQQFGAKLSAAIRDAVEAQRAAVA
jgi:hypothetical protein